jgi:hypothetical protein
VSTYTTSLRRVVIFTIGVAVGSILLTGAASAETTTAHGNAKGAGNEAHTSANPDNTQPQPASKADYSGHGANQHGSYDSTRDGSPSGNGNGKGEAKGKPCAGCVGKADNKNPKGQAPDGSDHNAGYECDRNHGVGRTNPAHTGCTTGSTVGVGGNDEDQGSGPDNTPVVQTPAPTDSSDKPVCGDGPMTVDANGDGVIDGRDCAQVLGTDLERAAPASPAASVLGNGGTRTFALASAGQPTVLGAAITGGVDALPRTGSALAGWVLLAISLLGIGLVLVRKAATAGR